MRPADKAKLISFYEADLASYGPQDARSLHWISPHTQQVRFQVLYGVGPWDGVSVADIGCGLGDFYGFLQLQGHRLLALGSQEDEARQAGCVRYAGYDLSPKMVAAAGFKYPGGYFRVLDILAEGFEQPCDYVVASGTFNIQVADHAAFFRNMIAAMYRHCAKAVAFNFLGPSGTGRLSDSLYYGEDPKVVLAFCRSLSPRVVLREGYLSGDYTIYMYKAP